MKLDEIVTKSAKYSDEKQIPSPDKLTRQQLAEIEEKEKTPLQKLLDDIIVIMPILCGIISVWNTACFQTILQTIIH